MVKKGWIPPRSPLSLIQEDLFPNEWLILVSCVLLNCTSRKQVEKIMPEFVLRWPNPPALWNDDPSAVLDVIKSLGFGDRRTKRLYELAAALIDTPCGPLWKDPRDLPGVGEYAARAHEIFCQGIIGDEEPEDGSLGRYWRWAKESNSYKI